MILLHAAHVGPDAMEVPKDETCISDITLPLTNPLYEQFDDATNPAECRGPSLPCGDGFRIVQYPCFIDIALSLPTTYVGNRRAASSLLYARGIHM